MTTNVAQLPPQVQTPFRTVADILDDARSSLERLEPYDAWTDTLVGGLLIDIRPHAQREQFGEIPGSFIIERNVLEWRLDPLSDARIDEATTHDIQPIIVCQEGYTSSLAAASLTELGLHRSTDVVGGFSAWERAGLPTTFGGTAAGSRVVRAPRWSSQPRSL